MLAGCGVYVSTLSFATISQSVGDSFTHPSRFQEINNVERIMKTLNKKSRALSLFVLCLALTGAGAAFAEKKLASKGQPSIKVMLSGDTERKGARVALDQAGMIKPGEIINWMIDSANEGNGAAREYKAAGQIPAGTAPVA